MMRKYIYSFQFICVCKANFYFLKFILSPFLAIYRDSVIYKKGNSFSEYINFLISKTYFKKIKGYTKLKKNSFYWFIIF